MSTHAPQFWSNLFCSKINSCHDCQRLNESPSSKQTEYQILLYPWARVINISTFLSAVTFPVAPAPSLLLENTSVLPLPSQLSRVLKIQVQGPSPPAMASISEIPKVCLPSSSVAFVFHPLPIPSVVFLISAFILRI